MDYESNLAPPPRTIRPRARTFKHLPVVAISNGQWLDEQGQLGDTKHFQYDLPQCPSTLFVKLGAADFLSELDAHFAEWDGDRWQWRVSTSERDIITPDGFRVATRISTVVHYFGFKGGCYHKIIDPVTMYGHGLDKIWPGEQPRLTKLLRWGVALRDFCDKNSMEVRPTMGAISSQFLTDRRFYPRKRRKVPAAINERVRHELPGNHYQLDVAPSSKREFSAWYLDQSRAHHYHARTIQLPDANSLYAYGFFKTLEGIAFTGISPNFYGLYCLDLKPPKGGDHGAWGLNPHKPASFVFSNELPHLTDMGYTVLGVRAAWGSERQDAGLARYAKWSEKQLTHYGDAAWLKPLLLSTYGVLATRPRTGEAVFKLAKSGEAVTLVTGNHELSGLMVRSSKRLEPGIANVLHRGMIEAGTRSESVGLAQWLTTQGFRVLSIYADAVMVENDGDNNLPSLPAPWRCKEELNHLQFVSKQAFISGEMTKLPGVTGELRAYARNSTGRAPRKTTYDNLSGKPTRSNRRI